MVSQRMLISKIRFATKTMDHVFFLKAKQQIYARWEQMFSQQHWML